MMNIARTCVCVCLVSWGVAALTAARPSAKPMSVDNRLLLNRLILNGERHVEVMLACAPSEADAVIELTGTLGGSARYVDRVVGYVRVDIPIERLVMLVNDPKIDAYQITSLSMWGWYRDGPWPDIAELMRNQEITPAVRMVDPASRQDLPVLAASAARQAGYTGDEGMGIEQWMLDHPTFDGRGVTIAFPENALPEFAHPTLASAKALDGHEVDKIAGVLNSIDPTGYDETRVALSREIDATSSWVEIEGRTFILPHPGQYLFGVLAVRAGGNLRQEFGVLRDRTSGEIWVDTDGDADFRNEQPVVGLDRKFEVRSLKMSQPRKAELAFVVVADEAAATVHIYPSTNNHQAMTISVAAGSRTEDGLAYGVAPAARVLLVRASRKRLADLVEGYLMAAARPDVDILQNTDAIILPPDTQRDFLGLIFSRIVNGYHKPIFQGAGNFHLQLSSVQALGDVFSVGGMISPATYASFIGRGTLPEILVHPASAGGPSADGALKPDFLAPVARIAAGTCTRDQGTPLPKYQPTTRIPACYKESCCTSATSPYAAGLAALLISAAKQTGIDYSVQNLARALRASARFLPGVPAYEQGAGVLNVKGAWQELQRRVVTPHISVSGENRHALTPYATGGSTGLGIYEVDGWTVGSTGVRKLQLRRDTGSAARTEYRLSWTGNDGTFSSQSTVALPLKETVSLPISIAPRTGDVHSAILNLHEPGTDAIVLRSLVTIVVPEHLEAPTFAARFDGRLPLMRGTNHFWTIQEHTTALSIELTVKRGSVQATTVPSHGMTPYYQSKYPWSLARTLSKGSYHFVIPDPNPGVWSINVVNGSAWREADPASISAEDAEYSVAVRAFDASVQTGKLDEANAVTVLNNGSGIAEPLIKQSWGTITSDHATFNPNGVANRFDIQVPSESAALLVNARTEGVIGKEPLAAAGLDVYLYDCTSGQCFLHDVALPASRDQRLVIRKPRPGHWVAMIDGVPWFPASGSFSIDAVVVNGSSETVSLPRPLAYGESRTVPSLIAPKHVEPPGRLVRVFEVFDRALLQLEATQPWLPASDAERLGGPPALGVMYQEGEFSRKRPASSVR